MSVVPPRSTLRPRGVRRTRLTELAALVSASPLPVSAGGVPDDVAVSGVTLDSRLVVPGDLYVALGGRARHGVEFAAAAVGSGAVAVLTDPAGVEAAGALGCPVLVVPDARYALARVAARVYGDPASAMTTYAITGTNGKTTTAYLLDAALRSAGVPTGVVGTLGFLLDGKPLDGGEVNDTPRTTVTTPEASELQGLLALMGERGARACVLEVSSHALVLGRVDALVFDVAAFTNLGRDHLDFHGTLEAYFEAKASLFTPERTRSAVISIDDPRGRVLLGRVRAAGLPVATVSLTEAGADYLVTGTAQSADRTTAVSLRTPTGPIEFWLALPGAFNVRNAVTALAMLDGRGVDLQQAARGLAAAAVPGRMQRVPLGAGAPAVFVDFAHTPQAVASALAATPGRRRIAVIGAGGDRDPDKRPDMGAAAVRNAEVVVVTDDNPRSEEPAAIRGQVLDGARRGRPGRATNEVIDGGDRRTAIRTALELAGPDDVLVVLGKGHETGQELGDVVLPFDDTQVVAEEWSRLRRHREAG